MVKKIGLFENPCICLADNEEQASQYGDCVIAILKENLNIYRYDGIEFRCNENIPLDNLFMEIEGDYYYLGQVLEQTYDEPEEIKENDLLFHGTSWKNAEEIVDCGFLKCEFNDNSIQ